MRTLIIGIILVIGGIFFLSGYAMDKQEPKQNGFLNRFGFGLGFSCEVSDFGCCFGDDNYRFAFVQEQTARMPHQIPRNFNSGASGCCSVAFGRRLWAHQRIVICDSDWRSRPNAVQRALSHSRFLFGRVNLAIQQHSSHFPPRLPSWLDGTWLVGLSEEKGRSVFSFMVYCCVRVLYLTPEQAVAVHNTDIFCPCDFRGKFHLVRLQQNGERLEIYKDAPGQETCG